MDSKRTFSVANAKVVGRDEVARDVAGDVAEAHRGDEEEQQADGPDRLQHAARRERHQPAIATPNSPSPAPIATMPVTSSGPRR